MASANGASSAGSSRCHADAPSWPPPWASTADSSTESARERFIRASRRTPSAATDKMGADSSRDVDSHCESEPSTATDTSSSSSRASLSNQNEQRARQSRCSFAPRSSTARFSAASVVAATTTASVDAGLAVPAPADNGAARLATRRAPIDCQQVLYKMDELELLLNEAQVATKHPHA